MSTPATSTKSSLVANKPERRAKTPKATIERYRAEAKEIAAAKLAMQRLHRGVEFEPEPLRYVTDLNLL